MPRPSNDLKIINIEYIDLTYENNYLPFCTRKNKKFFKLGGVFYYQGVANDACMLLDKKQLIIILDVLKITEKLIDGKLLLKDDIIYFRKALTREEILTLKQLSIKGSIIYVNTEEDEEWDEEEEEEFIFGITSVKI